MPNPDSTSMVTAPKTDSYKHLLSCLGAHNEYNNSEYIAAASCLEDETPESLEEKGAKWHRLCYRDATSKQEINRVKARHENMLESGYKPKRKGRPSNKISTDESEAKKILLSQTCPFDAQLCFFCQN